MKPLNHQGKLIMAAGALMGYNTVPKLAKATGIPYQTLHKDLTNDFGSMTAARLRAVIRATHMKQEMILELIKE